MIEGRHLGFQIAARPLRTCWPLPLVATVGASIAGNGCPLCSEHLQVAARSFFSATQQNAAVLLLTGAAPAVSHRAVNPSLTSRGIVTKRCSSGRLTARSDPDGAREQRRCVPFLLCNSLSAKGTGDVTLTFCSNCRQIVSTPARRRAIAGRFDGQRAHRAAPLREPVLLDADFG